LKALYLWCKKRVEIPLDLPEANAPHNTEKQPYITDDIALHARSFCPWPMTKMGRIILGALLLVYIFQNVIFAIFVLMCEY